MNGAIQIYHDGKSGVEGEAGLKGKRGLAPEIDGGKGPPVRRFTVDQGFARTASER